MGRIILGLIASLLVASSFPARANTLEPPLYDLLLRDDYRPVVTIKKYPSLCWVLKNKPPVDATMTFTLRDPRSIKPVFEVKLPRSIQTEQNETCDCVNLKDYDIQLELDIVYRWYISIAQNPESHSRHVVIGGLIDRCGEENCQIQDMPSRCDRDFVRVLVRSGFLTDAMSCLCDLIKSSPDDKTLLRMRDALMKQLDLRFGPN